MFISNMNLCVGVLSLFAVVAAGPTSLDAEEKRKMPALEHEEIHDEFGQFALRYVTAEGTVVSERGRLVPTPDGTGYVMILEGEVSYIGDDGKVYVTKYSAGLDGTHVEGNHLPVPVTPEPVIAPEPVVVSEPVVVPEPVIVAEPYVVRKPVEEIVEIFKYVTAERSH